MSMIFTLTSHQHGPTHTGSTTCIVHTATIAGTGEAHGIHHILSMVGATIRGATIHGTVHSTATGDIHTMDITDTTIMAGDILMAMAIIGEVATTVLFTKSETIQ